MGIVDLGACLIQAGGQLGELRAVVCGDALKDRLEGVPVFALERRHRLAYAGCRLALEDPDDGLSADPLNQGEQNLLLGFLEQHAVDLPVSKDRPVIDLCRTLIDAFPEDTLIVSRIDVPGPPAQLLGQVDVLGREDSAVDIAIQGVGAHHLLRAEQFKVQGLPYNGIRRETLLLHERVCMLDELFAGEELGLTPDVGLAGICNALCGFGKVTLHGLPRDNLENASPMDLPGYGGPVHAQFLGDPGLAVAFADHEGNEDTVGEQKVFKLGLGYGKISLSHKIEFLSRQVCLVTYHDKGNHLMVQSFLLVAFNFTISRKKEDIKRPKKN